jgi:hypothetical protein
LHPRKKREKEREGRDQRERVHARDLLALGAKMLQKESWHKQWSKKSGGVMVVR